MEFYSEKIRVGGKEITVETGHLARQADAAVTMRCGDTIVLVTAVASNEPRDVDFFPLTIDVEEKMYAAGKIPGGFIKREGRPSEKSILTARLIDRPLRPSFAEGFRNETQVIATVLSVDQMNPPDVLALVGASTALTISDIPFEGPIGGVRVGRVDGEWLINPTFQELERSDIDLVVAGTRDAILMVEAGASEVPEEEILEGFEIAQAANRELVEFQERLREIAGVPKREVVLAEPDTELEGRVRAAAAERLSEALRNADKLAREAAVAAVRQDVVTALAGEEGPSQADITKILYKLEKELMRRMILKEGIRVDGRKTDEIRPISCAVGLLPRTHGSGLFTRGQTQVLSVVTLGTVGEIQRLDGLGIEEYKRFLHHYNFPPFSTGEAGFLRGPRRREIGHGALVERALTPILPAEEDFPYTIRIVSEVLESNGSSSMASCCGSTLGMMDAGIPILAPVAGVAMGLIKEGEDFAVLSDIQGLEDALGDMDFKVAGTEKGITALQMDMKVSGVDRALMQRALAQAREGRLFILGKMLEVLPEPRTSMSEFAPRILTLQIPVDKIRDVIGPGGRMIRSIIEDTGADIDIQDDGTVFVSSKDHAGGERAKRMIEQLTKEVEPGEKYLGHVTRIMPFGAFVEVLPGKEGLVHISRLAPHRVEKVEDVVNVGDEVEVEVTEIDRQNRINLTVAGVEAKPGAERRDRGREREGRGRERERRPGGGRPR
ncbi:MAG: polyribonucleotide nucleotidyltransferase [Actinobacteria bacterium]|nr:MAG: polyribonucleotide nucleotidyltransferase [Actinomycetota bacterium]